MAWILGIALLVACLFFFPRLTLSLIALSALAISILLYNEHRRNEEYRTARARTEERKREVYSRIRLTLLQYNSEKCPIEAPIIIVFENRSNLTVTGISFTFEGYHPNYSNPVFGSGYQEYESDRIIEPGDPWLACWPVPKRVRSNDLADFAPIDAVWKVTDIDYKFLDPIE